MDVGAIFSADWQVVRNAPTAFLIAVTFVAGAIWIAVNWQYKSQVGSLKARNELLDATVADYKRKLEGASPDEARDKIVDLERRLAAIENKDLMSLSHMERELAERVAKSTNDGWF